MLEEILRQKDHWIQSVRMEKLLLIHKEIFKPEILKNFIVDFLDLEGVLKKADAKYLPSRCCG